MKNPTIYLYLLGWHYWIRSNNIPTFSCYVNPQKNICLPTPIFILLITVYCKHMISLLAICLIYVWFSILLVLFHGFSIFDAPTSNDYTWSLLIFISEAGHTKKYKLLNPYGITFKTSFSSENCFLGNIVDYFLEWAYVSVQKVNIGFER